MKPRIQSFLPLLVVGALALAGCGGDDSSSNDPTTPTQPEVVVVNGEITGSETWTADNQYLIQGALFVREGATLTIQAGTTIFGDQATTGTLVVARGGQLIAQGTASNPIVFTSSAPVGSRARGQWGGLILNGRAPLNIPGGEKEGEGGTGTFGGNDPGDSSGILRYIRVEYAGIEFSPDNELNGIAFQGVGAGTACDHLQVHFNLDDAYEWFGGTAACKYLVASAAGDDSFDWTDGFQGRGQFWIAQQKGDDADNGFECDNLEGAVDATPRSMPTIYNVTLIGDPTENYGTQSARGMVLRRGTGAELRNFIVQGFKRVGVYVDQGSYGSDKTWLSGELTLGNSIITGNLQGSIDGPSGGWAFDLDGGDPEIADPYNLSSPDFMPSASGIARNGTLPVATPPNDGFFEAVDYIGGMGGTDWTQGWTDFSQN
ncbi:MAG: hypothetical protein LJF15_04680 [Acidobacteria bacterium]|nr:hypothetical protein [Acidobacteriota bacterium]